LERFVDSVPQIALAKDLHPDDTLARLLHLL
jgi:hypothetical protein